MRKPLGVADRLLPSHNPSWGYFSRRQAPARNGHVVTSSPHHTGQGKPRLNCFVGRHLARATPRCLILTQDVAMDPYVLSSWASWISLLRPTGRPSIRTMAAPTNDLPLRVRGNRATYSAHRTTYFPHPAHRLTPDQQARNQERAPKRDHNEPSDCRWPDPIGIPSQSPLTSLIRFGILARRHECGSGSENQETDAATNNHEFQAMSCGESAQASRYQLFLCLMT